MRPALPGESGEPPGAGAKGKGESFVPRSCLSNSAIQTAPFLAAPLASKSSTQKTLPLSLGCTEGTLVETDLTEADSEPSSCSGVNFTHWYSA